MDMSVSPSLHPPKAMLLWLTMLLSLRMRGSDAVSFSYHSQQRLKATLDSLHATFPNLTHVYSIGKSVQGVDLWVIAIGKHAAEHTPLVPNVKYIANMHGNEVVGRELLLHLASHYLDNYSTNSTLTHFLDNTRVHLMPCMNPDGFAVSRQGDCKSVKGRNNANGFDLNRNFPDYIVGNKQDVQQETRLVKDWIAETPFVLSANLHGGAMVANYPFDYAANNLEGTSYARSPDDDVFRHLALTYSKSHATMSRGQACGDSFTDGITNGAMWYPVVGGMQDYMYRSASGYEMLVELSCCKYPEASELSKFWDDNKNALVNFLFQVHRGVKGIILGQSSPLSGAKVTVRGREEVVFYSSKWGEFYKILMPGQYVLQVSAPGYIDTTKTFTVSSSGPLILNVTLLRMNSNSGGVDTRGGLPTRPRKNDSDSDPGNIHSVVVRDLNRATGGISLSRVLALLCCVIVVFGIGIV